MSLNSAALIAFSGLSAAQVQISIASSNISNADTAGYTEEIANQVADVTNGVGTGVSITGIGTNIDQLLLKSLIGANSDLGSANTTNNSCSRFRAVLSRASTTCGSACACRPRPKRGPARSR